MTTYNKLQAVANWLEAAVVDARSTKAAPLDPSNDDIDGLVRTLRQWASAEAMGRSISVDATEFTASIVREAQAVRAERAAAARDDEAFRAQAEAPGFYVNPETDYRMASDLELVEAPAPTHAPYWNFQAERTETLCKGEGPIGVPVTCEECVRILDEDRETTRREHAAERALDQLA